MKRFLTWRNGKGKINRRNTYITGEITLRNDAKTFAAPGNATASPGLNDWVIDQLLDGYDVHVWDDGHDWFQSDDCDEWGNGPALVYLPTTFKLSIQSVTPLPPGVNCSSIHWMVSGADAEPMRIQISSP